MLECPGMRETYTPTIGLEVHAELKTKTKMFCDSLNDPDEKSPNKNICPICTGHPGTLPTINFEAVKNVLKFGLAINGSLADFSEFDRKNYFYPDIPKSYQISQYKYPLVSGGKLCGVDITRVHLEEDTAKSSHETGDYSLVDFNRAGIPLMELVTEPVIKSPEQAASFAKELQLLLRYLNISDADMEKGHMRIEANISVSKNEKFGTKVEVKNLNSFRSVEKAIKFEIERHVEVLERGEKIVQETRGWDEIKEETFSQRLKEESHDYRYFPEPDLPKLKISEIAEFSAEELKKDLPELPWKRRERFKSLGLKDEIVEIFVRDRQAGDFMDRVLSELENEKESILLAFNIASSVPSELFSELISEEKKGRAKSYSVLVKMRKENKLSNLAVQSVLAILIKDEGDPEDIANKNGLLQESDGNKINEIIEKIILSNPEVVQEYKSGKISSLEFLIGQAMKESRGKANPRTVRELMVKKLD